MNMDRLSRLLWEVALERGETALTCYDTRDDRYAHGYHCPVCGKIKPPGDLLCHLFGQHTDVELKEAAIECLI